MTLETCALCPRLCRHACPVAVGSGREAAVPALLAQVVLRASEGALPAELGLQAATLCVDCGGCQEACHLHQALPAALLAARAAWTPPPQVEALQVPTPGAEALAVEPDARSFARALAARLGFPVAPWKTGDGLGEALRGHPTWAERAAALRSIGQGRQVLVADGASARALTEAGVAYRWLPDLLPELAAGAPRCRDKEGGGSLRCCGGAGPLRRHHPATAGEVGRAWLRHYGAGPVDDVRCAAHLREVGWCSTDVIDRLLAGAA
jgi:hypothetical protein